MKGASLPVMDALRTFSEEASLPDFQRSSLSPGPPVKELLSWTPGEGASLPVMVALLDILVTKLLLELWWRELLFSEGLALLDLSEGVALPNFQ